MKFLHKSATSAFIIVLLVVGFSVSAPRSAQAATGDVLVLMQQLIERLQAQRDLLLATQQAQGGTASGSGDAAGGGSSVPASNSANTSAASSGSDSEVITCDTKLPNKFPNNKRMFKQKIVTGDVAGLLSAKVNVRIYPKDTIIRAEMQKKVDMFKSKAVTREDINEDILDRYGFTKAIIRTMKALGADPLEKAVTIMDCSKPSPSAF